MKLVFFISILSIFAFAHKLNAFTDYANGILYVQSYYANGDSCANCNLKIQENNGTLLYDGTLNKEGTQEIKISLTSNSKAIITANGGHLTQNNINVLQNTTKPIELNPSDTALQQMIEVAVAKEIRPILIELDKSKELSLEKIFSGLGYILGFFGIWALMRQKKA